MASSFFEIHLSERCSTYRRRVRKVCSPLQSPVKAASVRYIALVLLVHMALYSATTVTQTIVQTTIWTTKNAATFLRVIGDRPRRLFV